MNARWISGLRIAARTLGVVALLFVAAFSFSGAPAGSLSWTTLLNLALFPGMLVLGVTVGWQRPLLGGLLATLWYPAYGLCRQSQGLPWPRGWVLVAMTLPGLLFLIQSGAIRTRWWPGVWR